jgi:hypothetical protein
MDSLINSITLTIFGVAIGYVSTFLITKYKVKYDLKNAISNIKAKNYMELWSLCESNIHSREERLKKLKLMKKWYEKGGGLLLSFNATNHFLGALKILELTNDIDLETIKKLKKHLSWIRTEMKFEVGSYSKKEAKTKLPQSKLDEQKL